MSLVGENLMEPITGTLRIVARSEHQAREVAMLIPPHATLIVSAKYLRRLLLAVCLCFEPNMCSLSETTSMCSFLITSR
jgi:hypothetical protein